MTYKNDVCTLCPRECRVNRSKGEKGICGVSGEGILGARAALHMWEEPCISGDKGSGAVFFSGCPLPHVAIYPEINRTVTGEEYEELVQYAIDIGVENGFIQEGETAKESFIPSFQGEGWNEEKNML